MLPEDFIRYTHNLMGDELWGDLQRGLLEDPPTSIRMNPFKSMKDVDSRLFQGSVPWCSLGQYLRQRPTFTFDPLMHAGAYYVQEASSMFLFSILKQFLGERKQWGNERKQDETHPIIMLDLCAAPGGKSMIARSVLPEGSLLVCNEPMKTRAQILKENIQKFGHKDVIVTHNLPADYLRSGLQFDIILADVPCSGEGMFRKDAGAIGEWSLQNVEKCRKLQREIIEDAWQCLLPGGILIYSTCTFNTKENEENVRFLIEKFGADIVSVQTEDSWNITGSLLQGFQEPVYRFIPGRSKGEGLFAAVLRKPDDNASQQQKPARSSKNKKGKHCPSLEKCRSYLGKVPLLVPYSFEILQEKEHIIAIPKAWFDTYWAASKQLNVIHAGIVLGEMKGKSMVPDQSLALSTTLDTASYPHCELNYQQAIQYLRKEAIVLPETYPTGFVIVSYRSLPLGFVKNLGNRANNLYPTEWKIKSTHIPENPIIL
ncbi:MAG: RsmB/NOP family class I SAM-dependent RNA methyltransferase [Prevotella sp.]|nr:RsmB/NOP family class I SAM-dependent RNA methyltransferase [Prevotella sp.]